jgi:hypothetical protein
MGGQNSFMNKATGIATTSGAFNPSGGGWLQGGGGGGGKTAGVDPTQAAWMQFYQNQQQQNAAMQQQALAAEQQAIKQAQKTAAQGSQLEGEQRAQQQLGLQNAYQQMQDATATNNLKTATANAPTGGAYNFNLAQQNQLSNLGAAGGLPPSAANQAGSMMPTINPAATTAANLGTGSRNQIQSPAVGKTLGGY